MKDLIEKMIRFGLVGIVIGAMVVIVGCSSSGSSSGGGGGGTTNNEFVGSWKVTGPAEAWLYIDSNNTFVWADVPDKTHPHFSGTWSVTNGTFKGPFTNPGVGTGDLIGTIANGVMTIDFVEHWAADKTLRYGATRLSSKITFQKQ